MDAEAKVGFGVESFLVEEGDEHGSFQAAHCRVDVIAFIVKA
jgi:hypothetical protein